VRERDVASGGRRNWRYELSLPMGSGRMTSHGGALGRVTISREPAGDDSVESCRATTCGADLNVDCLPGRTGTAEVT